MWTTKKILAAVAVLLILLVIVCFGISQNLQNLREKNITATQAARKAVEAHDLEAFKKYVDTENLIDLAAKEILPAQINSTLDPTTYSTDAIQTRYDNELKPDFVKSARAALEEYITTGDITFPDKPTDTQKFFKESGLASCEIKSITKPKLEGHVQYSTVIFYNTKMKFNFELELELTDSADGNWRITNAKGFENYYNNYRRALRHKLDSLNVPIVRQMDETFLIKSFTAQINDGDEYGFSETLNIAIKADVKSDKPLSKVIGNVILGGKNDRESFAPFEIDMTNQSQGVQTFNVTKTLNPFIPTDSKAMKHGFRKKDIHIVVTEIIFADGTSLKQLDHLPE